MKKIILSFLSGAFTLFVTVGISTSLMSCSDTEDIREELPEPEKPGDSESEDPVVPDVNWKFTMKQTLSQGAQVSTIAFSGVAFYSGSFFASTFYPPGKIADYFGFQFMRDNDFTEAGHNTDFLTKAAWHTMHILNEDQLKKLIDLANEQKDLFNEYALSRFVLIKAFHRYLDGDLPEGKTMLNIDKVKQKSAELYRIDGEISYRRAVVFAEVIRSLTSEQKKAFAAFSNTGMKEWSMPERPNVSIPQGLNTWVMSNASELFSWYLRGVDADIYFCPERQGTYFGGFYMKDAPAVGNPGYEIGSEITASKGAYLLNTILVKSQSDVIRAIYPAVTEALNNIVDVRTKIATELRKERTLAGSASKDMILSLSEDYGNYDGIYIYEMVERFVQVGRTLTDQQKEALVILRDLADFPDEPGKVFIFSAKTNEPAIPNTDEMFK
ncbi:MAG: hypothetical protein ACRCR3_12040 [Tannerellaceae bacterium]